MKATVNLSIDGAVVQAAAGSSVAAAIAACRPAALGASRRSVSGEPRAAFCGMGVCHECAVEIDGQRRLACQTPCRDGLIVRTAGNAATAARADATAAGLPQPAAAAPAARGIAAAPRQERCTLLIVGAGPAGLRAAQAAAAFAESVLVVDDNPAPGGQVWRDGPGATLPQPALALREALARQGNVRFACGTRVVARADAASGHALLLEDAASAWVQHADALLLATGARERLLPFPGWTLPGVTGAGGLQALIKGGLDVAGQRIVIAGSGPLLLAAAATARAAGGDVVAVLEAAPRRELAAFAAGLWRWPGKALQAMRLAPRGYRSASLVLAALGDDRLRAVRFERGGRDVELAADRLACGFGLLPSSELAQRLGCSVDAGGAVRVDAWQASSVAGVYAAGDCTGIAGSEAAQLQGTIAGLAACGRHDDARVLFARRDRWRRFGAALERRFAPPEALRRLPQPDTPVCRCEDVAHAALQRCNGFIEAKLQTRCGMGPCQGRICGAAAALLYGWQPPAPGHLLHPARIATLAAPAVEDGR